MIEVQLNQQQAKGFASALLKNEIAAYIQAHQEDYNRFLKEEAEKQKNKTAEVKND